MTATRVGVIGSGSWGTAIAGLLAGQGHDVVLWSFEEGVVGSIRDTGRNEKYLEGVTLPPSLQVTTDIAEAVSEADVVVSVSPAQFVARVMADAAPYLPEGALIVSASKGIETKSLRTMDRVLKDTLSEAATGNLVVLSGPSFAAEVARNAPTAVVVASRSEADAAPAGEILYRPVHRPPPRRDGGSPSPFAGPRSCWLPASPDLGEAPPSDAARSISG